MELIKVDQPEMLQALNRGEIDIQIATAKAHPRNLSDVLNKIRTYAMNDTETAEDCFYALRRGYGNDAIVIEGLSVRFAEIIASAWGNMRIQTRIIGNDGKTITAMGICHDLESNLAVSVEVKRRITDKYGKVFSEDMQVVTGNAASAIAFRNAVLKVVPKAMTKKIVLDVKEVAIGKSLDLEQSRQRAIAHFLKLGVKTEDLLKHLELQTVEQIDSEAVYYLRGLANSIKEGSTTIKETFGDPNDNQSKTIAAKAKEKAEEAKKKIEDAMSKGGASFDEPVQNTDAPKD